MIDTLIGIFLLLLGIYSINVASEIGRDRKLRDSYLGAAGFLLLVGLGLSVLGAMIVF